MDHTACRSKIEVHHFEILLQTGLFSSVCFLNFLLKLSDCIYVKLFHFVVLGFKNLSWGHMRYHKQTDRQTSKVYI